MPQIAQQDYKIIAPTPGRAFKFDVAALGKLKEAILNGIGFDCLIKDTIGNEGDINRVLGFYPDGSIVHFWLSASNEATEIEIPYTPAQYQGLAAVQAEIDRIDGLTESLPIFLATNGFLNESDSGWPIGTPEGYQYKVTLTDGKIATIEVSTIKIEGDYIAISIEDAQKLIGLPCSTN